MDKKWCGECADKKTCNDLREGKGCAEFDFERWDRLMRPPTDLIHAVRGTMQAHVDDTLTKG